VLDSFVTKTRDRKVNLKILRKTKKHRRQPCCMEVRKARKIPLLS